MNIAPKQNKTCPHCGGVRVLNLDYDAYYCPKCNIWLEEACGDPNCLYCGSRPNKPSEAKGKTDE